MKSKIKNQYKTNDFYQAVTLKTAGMVLVGLERSSEKFFYFVFNDKSKNAKPLLESYWKNDLKVDAREFVENINELKTRVHSGI